MKNIIFLLLLIASANADIIIKKSLGCPTLDALKKAPLENEESGLDLHMYAIANSCVIMNKRDKVQVIGDDPRNSKEIYQQVVYQKTGVMLYIPSSAVQIEQGGKKGILKF